MILLKMQIEPARELQDDVHLYRDSMYLQQGWKY